MTFIHRNSSTDRLDLFNSVNKNIKHLSTTCLNLCSDWGAHGKC